MFCELFLLLLTSGDASILLSEEPETDVRRDLDFEDIYDAEDYITSADVSSAMTTDDSVLHMRFRRQGDQTPSAVLTRSHYDMQEVKGALKEIMGDRSLETLFTTEIVEPKMTQYNIPKTKIYPSFTKFTTSSDNEKVQDIIQDLLTTRAHHDVDSTAPDNEVSGHEDVSNENSESESFNDKNGAQNYIHAYPRPWIKYEKRKNSSPKINVLKDTSYEFKPITVHQNIDSLEEYDAVKSAKTLDEDATNSSSGRRRQEGKGQVTKMPIAIQEVDMAIPAFDMPALLDMIANLTFDYGNNLTRRFNETFQKFQIPTCKTEGTVLPTTPEFNIDNATVVGKCFVCGLTTPEIPRNAYCADAFAGDFLPLVPVDPRARGQIARYRKYCRYLDVSGVMEFPEEPRSMFGRFTGGCSVRWIDLSGVYTQRACRNRRRAHTGKHFLSKRMAKLEMALAQVDNGCIVSPMASLVPLSRGISLYARFHACVCTGSWCNRSELNQTWMIHKILLCIWIIKATLYPE